VEQNGVPPFGNEELKEAKNHKLKNQTPFNASQNFFVLFSRNKHNLNRKQQHSRKTLIHR
jgi:hypothetical protein